ncbi:MAG: Smr/MutS family protein [Butyricicoccaceae bacterium]
MGQLRVINLEDDRPTVKEAIRRLQLEIRLAKSQDISVLKVIHGFGSTGKGGKIRPAVHQELERYLSRGAIGAYIPGEKLSIFDERTRQAINACPAFRKDQDIDRWNSGITVIVLDKKKGS